MVPVFSKVCERLTDVQIIKFLENLKILSEKQVGFRKGLGTNIFVKYHLFDNVFTIYSKTVGGKLKYKSGSSKLKYYLTHNIYIY